MATNLRNCRGTSHDGKGKEEHNCSKKENDGGEADDDGIIVDDDQGDAVIIPAAAYKKDGGGVDAPRKESFSSEIYCPEDFFIDEFNCGSYRDIDTELADETFCIDGFDERAASRIARTNVSAPEENNIDVQYEGRMVQDNDADPSFNAEKAPPPHPRMLYIIPSISSFAILGCLARIYTDILFHNRLGVTTTGKRERAIYCLEKFCNRWRVLFLSIISSWNILVCDFFFGFLNFQMCSSFLLFFGSFHRFYPCRFVIL